MTPKELLDDMLGFLGFVIEIQEQKNEAGNLVLQIYTEESRRLIGRNGDTLEAIQFLLNRLLQAKDKDVPKVIVDCEHYRSMREDRIVQRVRELPAPPGRSVDSQCAAVRQPPRKVVSADGPGPRVRGARH